MPASTKALLGMKTSRKTSTGVCALQCTQGGIRGTVSMNCSCILPINNSELQSLGNQWRKTMLKQEELPSRAGDVWVRSFQLRRPYSCRFRQSNLTSFRQKELAQCSKAPSIQCRLACVRADFPPRVHFLFRKVDRTQYAIVDSLRMLRKSGLR